MVKTPSVMAALLVLVPVAYAGNPSADLSVQVVPPAPAVPAPAAAAGFSTLALNADFTSSAYSNPATFVSECGATATQRWHWTYPYNSGPLNCNDISVVSDGSLPQVLHVKFPPNEWSTASNHQQGIFQFPSIGYTNNPPCVIVAPCYPIETYVEIMYRTSSSSWAQSNGVAGYIDVYPLGRGFRADGSFPPNDAFEADMAEVYNGMRSTANFGGGFGGIVNGQQHYGPVTYWNMDLTQYHKLGFLVTSDGATSAIKCTYLDNVLVAANNGSSACVNDRSYTFSQVASQHDNVIAFFLGTFAGTSTQPAVPVEAWVQYIHIWECSGWATGACPGATQYGPDSSGLTYWH
jgi:hypothetical protein